MSKHKIGDFVSLRLFTQPPTTIFAAVVREGDWISGAYVLVDDDNGWIIGHPDFMTPAHGCATRWEDEMIKEALEDK